MFTHPSRRLDVLSTRSHRIILVAVTFALLVTALLVTLCQLPRRGPHWNVLHGATFPDPSIIVVDGTSYVFGTVDKAGHNAPLTANSKYNNADGWSAPIDALPVASVAAFGSSGWALPYTAWAPDVVQFTDGDGSFGLYYSAEVRGSDPPVHCISLARSASVKGPYTDNSSGPFVCPRSAGGAIDVAGFLDDDRSRYIVYKIDGPAVHNGGSCHPSGTPSLNTSLMLQQVEPDGYTSIDGPTELYNNQGESDKYNVEAPSILKYGGVYFLFFSAGCTAYNSYTLDYVTASSLKGPYGNRQTLLRTGDFGGSGPGGADISDSLQMVFHSLQVSNEIKYHRQLNTATLSISGHSVKVN